MDIRLLVLTEHSYARPPGNSLRQSGPNLDETMSNDDNMEPVEVVELEDDVEIIGGTPYTPRPEVPVRRDRDPGEGNEGDLRIPWSKMRKITKEVERYKSFIPFLVPVDPVACNALNYYDVIKEPMDVETIAARIENKYYRSTNEWILDFQRIFSNCLEFNEDTNSNIRESAQAAMNIFEDKLENHGLLGNKGKNEATYTGTRKWSKTHQKEEHLQSNVATIESSSDDSDVEFLEMVQVARSENIASPGDGPGKKAGTSSSTISVASSEDMRDMPNLQRIREERSISFSSDGGLPPVLSPKLVKIESTPSSIGTSPKLQIVDNEQVSPSHYAAPDLVGDMDLGSSAATSRENRNDMIAEVGSGRKSSPAQEKKHVKTAKRRRRASASVSSVAATEAIAAMPEEKNGIVTNGESTVTKSGRKPTLTKRFTLWEPKVSVQLPPKLKYYKQFIDDMIHDAELKKMFPNILPPRVMTPAKECLREIKRKLDLKKYITPEELEEDMQLLLENKSDAAGEKEAMDFDRFEEGWNRIVKYWSPDEIYDNVDFTGFFAPVEDPLDSRKWTMVEIQDMLQKLDKIPLGKMVNIFHIMRTKELHHCPCPPNRKLDMIAQFGEFSSKSLNDIRKEVEHILVVMEREKRNEAADRARVERKLKQREAKLKKETPPEEDTVVDPSSGSKASSPSGSSSDSDSSSSSESSSSSSDTETESENDMQSEPVKQKKSIKSIPFQKKIYTNHIVLSESDSSDDDHSRLPVKRPLARETNAPNKAVSVLSSDVPRSDVAVAVPKSSKHDSQASSTDNRNRTEKNEHQSAPPPKPVQSTISFGIITIPVEPPGRKPEDEAEPEEFPELSDERKAMREEAAFLRRKHAINIDPIKMQELVDAFDTSLAYFGGEVYVRDATVLDTLLKGFSPREPDQEEDEDYLQDISTQQLRKQSSDEPRVSSNLHSGVAENVKDVSLNTLRAAPMDTEPTKVEVKDEGPSLGRYQNCKNLAEFTIGAENLKSPKAVSAMDVEPTKGVNIESATELRQDKENNVDEDSGDEVDMDALDFEDC